MNNTPTVFYHCDLDGIVSYLAVCWAFGNKKLLGVPTTPSRLIKTIDTWLQNNSFNNAKTIFVDLDVTQIADKIDHKNVYIFDHHVSNETAPTFENATVVVDGSVSSCAKLVAKSFNLKEKVDTAKLTLIALADDFDSHTNAIPLSYDLNVVFHNTQNKVNSFIEDYFDGFKPFDQFKQNIIAQYKKKVKEHLKEVVIYDNYVEWENQLIRVGATTGENYIAEIADYILETLECPVAIVVMPHLERFAARRHPNHTTTDLSQFVKTIAKDDRGGGHEAAAGGYMTEAFLSFASGLKPVN